MVKREFLEALNDCIDRMIEGESIEGCIADYPEYAGQLRQLLQTGELVHRAQAQRAEMNAAHRLVRSRLDETIAQNYVERDGKLLKRKRQPFTLMLVAMLITIVLGVGAIIGTLYVRSTSSTTTQLTSTVLVAVNHELIAQATQTAGVNQMLIAATQTANLALTSQSPNSEIETTSSATTTGGLDVPAVYLTATALKLPATSAGDLGADAVWQTATAVHQMLLLTRTTTPIDPNAVLQSATPLAHTLQPAATGPDTVLKTATSLAKTLNPYTIEPTSEASQIPPLVGLTLTSAASTQIAIYSTATSVANNIILDPPVSGMITPNSVLMTPGVIYNIEGTPLYGYQNPNVINAASQVPPVFVTPPAVQPTQLPNLTPLNAGEIDDNAEWDTYLQYRNNFLQSYPNAAHDVDVTRRQIITVTDSQGFPVLGARVRIFANESLVSESHTYADGRTLFFPNAHFTSRNVRLFRVVVDQGNASTEFTLNTADGWQWPVTLDVVQERETIPLDVLFLLDTTGSMSDEIIELQNNLLWISSQIADLPENADVRYGLVIYRDRGDAYVTKVYPFTPDIDTFQMQLNAVRANGGGDNPESLNQALYDALHSVEWRGEDAIKMVFLVVDAPPHLDYDEDYDYAHEIAYAAQQGIKIHTVASSGLDQPGEFILRQIAQYTMGHFVFLTYDNGIPGTPGDSRPELYVGTPENRQQQQAGDYTVEQLDELVLRLIVDEINALNVR